MSRIVEYTSKEFAQEAGVSLRQLQYWHERGFLVPARRASNMHGNGGRFWVYHKSQIAIGKRLAILVRRTKSSKWLDAFATRQFKKVVFLDSARIVGSTLFIPLRNAAPRPMPGGRKTPDSRINR